MAKKAAAARLRTELAKIHSDPPPYITVAVNERNVLLWSFLIEGPPETPYAGGWYWGRIKFPNEYPFKPPALLMVTPSGRFQPDTRLCLSMSDFHPETWNPGWTVATILTGLLSFMTGDQMTTGAIESSDAEKRRLAAASADWNRAQEEFVELFTDFDELARGGGSSSRPPPAPPAASDEPAAPPPAASPAPPAPPSDERAARTGGGGTAAGRDAGGESVTSTAPVAADDRADGGEGAPEELAVGARVVLTGLKSAQYNGQPAVVVGELSEGRHEVRLEAGGATIAVRVENLERPADEAKASASKRKKKKKKKKGGADHAADDAADDADEEAA